MGFTCCTVPESLVKSRRQDTCALLEWSPLVSDPINQCVWFNTRKHRGRCEWKHQNCHAGDSVVLNITFQRQPKLRFAHGNVQGPKFGFARSNVRRPYSSVFDKVHKGLGHLCFWRVCLWSLNPKTIQCGSLSEGIEAVVCTRKWM